jgi:hypothetical protein
VIESDADSAERCDWSPPIGEEVEKMARVSIVSKEQAGGRIEGHIDVRPSIVIKISDDRCHHVVALRVHAKINAHQ